MRVLATHRDASKHPCQGIAFGDSLRSGDMSDREAESNSGMFDFDFGLRKKLKLHSTTTTSNYNYLPRKNKRR